MYWVFAETILFAKVLSFVKAITGVSSMLSSESFLIARFMLLLRICGWKGNIKGMLFSVSVRLSLSCRNFGLSVYRTWLNVLHRRDYTIFSENLNFFCPCHNFFPLSSVQIIIIPACCLLCVL